MPVSISLLTACTSYSHMTSGCRRPITTAAEGNNGSESWAFAEKIRFFRRRGMVETCRTFTRKSLAASSGRRPIPYRWCYCSAQESVTDYLGGENGADGASTANPYSAILIKPPSISDGGVWEQRQGIANNRTSDMLVGGKSEEFRQTEDASTYRQHGVRQLMRWVRQKEESTAAKDFGGQKKHRRIASGFCLTGL